MVGDAFKALGDPTRRRILELLSEGEMSAGDIAAVSYTHLTLPTN